MCTGHCVCVCVFVRGEGKFASVCMHTVGECWLRVSICLIKYS